MWVQRPEVRQEIHGRVRAVSVPNEVRKLLVSTDSGFYKIVFLKTARSSRVPKTKREHFDTESGTIKADGHTFAMYGHADADGPIYTPALTTSHPAGDRLEPEPASNTLRILGPDGSVRQIISHFFAGSEPWAMAAFTPNGDTLVVADPRGVRLFGFTPDVGREPTRWQASGNKGERDALVNAIIENPDDDTLRLVFADWLDENGDTDRAEFIRLQVRRGYNWEWSTPDTQEDYRRERVLWKRYGDRWTAELPRFRGVYWNCFFRGFPQIRVRNAVSLLQKANAIWAASPVEQVTIGTLQEEHARGLIESPLLERIRALSLGDQSVSTFGLRVLLGSARIRGMRAIRWGGYSFNFRDEGVRAIATSPNLANLEELSLGYGNVITDEVALELARSRSLPKLFRVQLSTHRFEPDVIRELKARFPTIC